MPKIIARIKNKGSKRFIRNLQKYIVRNIIPYPPGISRKDPARSRRKGYRDLACSGMVVECKKDAQCASFSYI
jgi:hypothetical protein